MTFKELRKIRDDLKQRFRNGEGAIDINEAKFIFNQLKKLLNEKEKDLILKFSNRTLLYTVTLVDHKWGTSWKLNEHDNETKAIMELVIRNWEEIIPSDNLDFHLYPEIR